MQIPTVAHAIRVLLLGAFLLICPASVAAEPDGADAPPYFDGLMGSGFFRDRDDYILGKVTSAKKDHLDHFDVVYEIEVICNYRGNLKEKDVVFLSGNYFHTGSNIRPTIPEFEIGTLLLFKGTPMRRKGDYSYPRDYNQSPFGLGCPRKLALHEVDDIRIMLAKLRELVPPDGKGTVDVAAARQLLKSERYALFAIGVSLLAYEGGQEAVGALIRVLQDYSIPLERAVWIEHALHDFVPKSVRLDHERLRDYFMGYLDNRLDTLDRGDVVPDHKVKPDEPPSKKSTTDAENRP
jgi:hypothetical protein